MWPHEIVVGEEYGKRAAVVLKALREGVGPGGEPLHAGPHRQVLALSVGVGDASFGVLQRVDFIPERGLDRQGLGLEDPGRQDDPSCDPHRRSSIDLMTASVSRFPAFQVTASLER